MVTRHGELRQRDESFGIATDAQGAGGVDGGVSGAGREGFGAVEAEGAHGGELVVFFVATEAFATFFGIALDIDDVVLHLKSETDGGAPGAGGVDDVGTVGGEGAEGGAGSEEAAGFLAVDFAERFEALLAQRAAFALHVVVLASDHARAAGGEREFEDLLGGDIFRACEHGEGVGQQAIADEHRGAFVESLVHGGSTAAQVVVVERRQIVVHERVGVHEFEGDGGGQGKTDGDGAVVVGVAAIVAVERFSDGETDEGTQPFAAGEDGVVHRVAQTWRRARAIDVDKRAEVGTKGIVDEGAPWREVIEDGHGASPLAAGAALFASL